MSDNLSQSFKDWMRVTGKSANTVSNYASGVNAVSNHGGSQVLAIDDKNELERLYAVYGPGGEHAEMGRSNSNNVQSGLRQWLIYQRERQGLAMEAVAGYANHHVQALLAKRPPEQAAWFWMVVRMLRARWPKADHYTTNTSPPDVRVGRKDPVKINGKVAFHLRGMNASVLTCDVRDLADYRDQLQAHDVAVQVSSQDHPSAQAVADWLDRVMQVIAVDALPMKGEGRMPSAYTNEKSDNIGETPVSNAQNGVVPPLNQILFGPPGTGKTYNTINQSLAILAPDLLDQNEGDDPENRERLKTEFDRLVAADRIRFVTFHQSFSYEDFVEGLRATTDENTGQLRYEVVDGVFKSLCEAASAKVTQQAEAPTELGKRRIWKMSLGNTQGEDASIYQECLSGGYVLLGYGGVIDFAGCSSRQQVQSRFADAGVVPANPATDYGITSVTTFVAKMKVGDLIVVSDGNLKFRAIGEVMGDYQFKPHAEFEDGYAQRRPVKWLRQYQPSLPHTELLNGQFSQMTLYELRSPALDRDKLQTLLGAAPAAATFITGQVFGREYKVVRASTDLLELKKPNGNLLPFSMSLLNELAEAVRQGRIVLQDIRDKTAIEKLPGSTLEPFLVNGYNNILASLVEYLIGKGERIAAAQAGPDARVLIIDEINRGNISRIFGELITLIEASKRAGADEALSVVLPYSKQRFSVPSNLYLIGTMNTADRSLAGLDMALRRRFVFKEMPPNPDLLRDVMVGDLPIRTLLEVMNQRIEVLLDRDHCLGHAYFMPLLKNNSLEQLAVIFRNQILPLLQEYFFEDWQRIQWVFNDHRKPAIDRFIEQDKQDVTALFGNISVPAQGAVWRINTAAFERASAYAGIIAAKLDADASTQVSEESAV